MRPQPPNTAETCVPPPSREAEAALTATHGLHGTTQAPATTHTLSPQRPQPRAATGPNGRPRPPAPLQHLKRSATPQRSTPTRQARHRPQPGAHRHRRATARPREPRPQDGNRAPAQFLAIPAQPAAGRPAGRGPTAQEPRGGRMAAIRGGWPRSYPPALTMAAELASLPAREKRKENLREANHKPAQGALAPGAGPLIGVALAEPVLEGGG